MKSKIYSFFIIIILTFNTAYAYKADCVIRWYDTGGTQKFHIVVKNGKMIRYASYGTFIEYYRGKEDGYFHYNAGDGDYETYLGAFKNGKFSYRTTANNGDGLSGICTLR